MGIGPLNIFCLEPPDHPWDVCGDKTTSRLGLGVRVTYIHAKLNYTPYVVYYS